MCDNGAEMMGVAHACSEDRRPGLRRAPSARRAPFSASSGSPIGAGGALGVVWSCWGCAAAAALPLPSPSRHTFLSCPEATPSTPNDRSCAGQARLPS